MAKMYGMYRKTPAKDEERRGLRDLIGSRWSKACQDYLTPIRSGGSMTCEGMEMLKLDIISKRCFCHAER